jgi:hypothetical protein
MYWGCGPRPLLRGWFREDGLRGQNLNMVLTIITINSSYTILFLIRSQINECNHLADTRGKRAAENCSSLVVPLCTFGSLVTSFYSGHCTKLAVFQFVYSGPCLNKQSWSDKQAFSLPLLKILVWKTQCRGQKQLSKLVSIIRQLLNKLLNALQTN